MRYLSVCSGIEAATVAWHHIGWTPAAFSEIEPFPSAVLAHHYPAVPNMGDMTKYKEWDIGAIDLLVGGTPCQSFSVAGLRKGLADPRGNLALVYLGIADLFKPKWIVWENVPGVLSSAGGRDFGSFLGALAQLGYGFAYRVLDAQWFGVAQRRRRVFVVGYLGDWRPAAAVLFERQSLRRDTAPSRKKGQVTPTLTKECTGVSRTGHNEDGWYVEVANTLTKCGAGGHNLECGETYLPVVAPTLNASDGDKWGCNQWVNEGKAILQPIPYDLHQVTAPVNRQAREPGDPCHTLAKQNAHNAGIVHGVAQPIGFDAYNNDVTGDVSKTIDTGQDYHHVPNLWHGMAVRRLTPVECERLQGFPDNYTEIPWRGKETPDGPRYKALGNSMAVPVMKWIGERIALLPTRE